VVDLVQRLGVKPVDPFSAGPVLSTSLGRAGGAGADSETGEEAGGGSFWLGFGGNSGAGGGASGSGNGVGGFLGLPSPILSWERMPRNLGESWGKFVGGVDFYATGTKLLGDDINVSFNESGKWGARIWQHVGFSGVEVNLKIKIMEGRDGCPRAPPPPPF